METLRRARPLFLTCLCLAYLAPGALAEPLTLDKPGEREFVRDLADLITAEDEQKIRETCDRLLSEKATPVIVVTIESMAKHGGADMRIEEFAMRLFNQWGIGHEKLGDRLWNTGILLLVSKEDRKARIELGAGWKRDKDELAAQIMQEQIIPRFKEGQFSAGIVAGVEALSQMARGLELPTQPRPWWHWGLLIAGVALLIFTIVSLFRRGASGWAWLFWGALFALIGYLLYQMMTKRHGRGGGSFSGGSFGGGFSGGGGATGSW
jgi:uncharacterized protein